jgi:lipid-A-disaccharide synthase
VPPPIPIFISAGEDSGDLYGALLIQALRQRLGDAQFFGCGGEKMRAAGCETVVDARQIAMVGLVEVVPGLPRVWRAFRRIVESLRTRRPALAILIDFPEVNLRLAKKLKRAGIEVVYFIAPQVWAWRRGRLAALRRYVDRLLCIFPFEEEFFLKAGVRAEFVGHPLVGRVAPTMTSSQFRRLLGAPENLPLIALLPGSRRGEISLNLPPMLAAARHMAPEGEYGFVLAAASREAGEFIRSQMGDSEQRFWVLENLTYDAVAHASAAIVASGTATIVTALLGTPMVVVYRVTPATWWLGRKLVRTPFYSMVNIVAGREIVPELIQGAFQPEMVARAAKGLLENQAANEEMRKALRELAERLCSPGSSVAGRDRPDSPDADAPADAGRLPLEASANAVADAIERSVSVTESVLRARFSLEGNS